MEKILRAVNSKKCIGCGNCKMVCNLCAIEFTTITGFQYPQIDMDKCIHCGKCDRVCPVNGNPVFLSSPISYFAAYVNPKIMSSDSTSGGICTFASETVIRNGGVVYSAGFTKDWSVDYSRVDTLDKLKNHVGSKYMQAYFNNIQVAIADDVKKSSTVLLIGTPCFISAIKKYLAMTKVDMQNLLTIDFLCHGVPSAEIGQQFIKELEEEAGKKLEKYNFRSKAFGWGRLSRSIKFYGKKEKAIRADFCPLHTWFGKHFSLRESCFACDYRSIARPSDITVADFWKIEKYYPEIPIRQGVSSVQINSQKGEQFFKKIISSGEMIVKPVSEESIWEHRKTATKNFDRPEGYEEFWKIWSENGLKGIRQMVPPQTLSRLIKEKLKSSVR